MAFLIVTFCALVSFARFDAERPQTTHLCRHLCRTSRKNLNVYGPSAPSLAEVFLPQGKTVEAPNFLPLLPFSQHQDTFQHLCGTPAMSAVKDPLGAWLAQPCATMGNCVLWRSEYSKAAASRTLSSSSFQVGTPWCARAAACVSSCAERISQPTNGTCQ